MLSARANVLLLLAEAHGVYCHYLRASAWSAILLQMFCRPQLLLPSGFHTSVSISGRLLPFLHYV